ncbi:MAG: hypothetical protein UT86_C0003G0013 [Candidatus Magasanikbacteria bacterium GW2011_GWC2_40_17]|uniref:Uncharacterized protein n=1 Tax=Candidatus Magasanikbacteria bacterium GW2011_GWA2_42_32 TaxID=1619039 RepID=A0A0G1CDY6_9BACT|nr:MAG: hypothetical protein UT86_C0003G0013 [Candidatus Magasanikbacteria bacterium GW2011_GWC2_40_17]KKS56916.1 MAG: hypothetical protein UV20_C0004G0012 [Candidatus Magasanikbacteria bacterium GW2011_GWA2_42_32]OGH85514.1 MAG: hypothetical protein A2294_03215 [Candidatus Magasanikbacteria bacterium RIFOXYB2_FULL_38_10]
MKRVVQNALFLIGVACFAVAVIALVIRLGKIRSAHFNQLIQAEGTLESQESVIDIEPVVEGANASIISALIANPDDEPRFVDVIIGDDGCINKPFATREIKDIQGIENCREFYENWFVCCPCGMEPADRSNDLNGGFFCYRPPVEANGTMVLAEERLSISRNICCPQNCIVHFEEFRSWLCPVDNCK